MLNRLIKSLLLFLALILITSISCTNSKTLDDNSREILPIEKSSLTINAELNDLKTELATQQSEIKSKAFQVSALEETKKSLSNQLSEKNQKLSNLEIQLKETNSKLITGVYVKRLTEEKDMIQSIDLSNNNKLEVGLIISAVP